MTVSRNVAGFKKAILQRGIELKKVNRQAVDRAAFKAKQVVETELTKAIGGDHVMSRFADGRQQLKVGYDVKGKTNAVAILSPRGTIGAWYLLEYGSGPFTITLLDPPPMLTPYGPRYRIKHPGVPAKKVFANAKRFAYPLAKRELEQRYTKWLAGRG